MPRFGVDSSLRSVILVAAATTGMILMPVDLAASKVGGADTTKNLVGDKTDFHLELGGSTAITVSSATLNGIAGTITNNGTTGVTIDWTVNTKRNDVVKWKWEGTQPGDKNVSKQKANFTPKTSPTDVPTLGWDIHGTEVFLLNDFTEDIAFENLLFQFPINFTADSLLDLAEAGPVGVPGLIGSGTVPAQGQLKVAEFALSLGSFLTFTYDSSFVDPAFSEHTTRGAIGHEVGVPEPSAITLLGIAGLWFIRSRCQARRA